MTTPLSSKSTPLYRFVLPWLVLAGMLFAAGSAYLHPESLNGPSGWTRDYAWALMLAFGIVMFAILWFVGGRVMKVELDGDELIISNYRVEIRVPLAQVEAIKGPTWTNPPRYTLVFAETTEFGDKVTFIPPQSLLFRRVAESKAIGELKSAWEQARSGRRAR